MADGQMGAEGPQRFREPDERDAQPAGRVPDLPLLEKVLQETLSSGLLSEPLPEPQWQALLTVARRHRGQALVLDPVAVELIEAVLRLRLDQLQLTDELWQRVSREIATTLLDDPQTQQRLERFWGQLGESIR